METHAHHLHKAPGRGFQHYLFEFFMLFLAVFSGFLAESWREHLGEVQREKKYMQMMTEDLEQDLIWTNNWLKRANQFPGGMDSLISICYLEKYNDDNIKTMYALNNRYMQKLDLNFADRTSAQLKNAGGMRLIHVQKVADLISQYWKQETEINNIYDNYDGFRKNTRELSFRIFNYKYYLKDPGALQDGEHYKQVLLDANPKTLVEYANHVTMMKDILNEFFIPTIERHKDLSAALIRVIKKEYHLE
jgi:hypothetical protein